MTVREFIEKLERISEDKKDLPIIIVCQNGLEIAPSIKMKFENYG